MNDNMARAEATSDGAARTAPSGGAALAHRMGEVYVELLSASQLTEDLDPDAHDAMISAIDLIATYWKQQDAADLRVSMEAIHDGLLDLLNEIAASRRDPSSQ